MNYLFQVMMMKMIFQNTTCIKEKIKLMRNKNYSRPYQVRLHTVQEDTLNKIMNDNEYCHRKNIISKSDVIRTALFSLCKDYELEKYNQRLA